MNSRIYTTSYSFISRNSLLFSLNFIIFNYTNKFTITNCTNRNIKILSMCHSSYSIITIIEFFKPIIYTLSKLNISNSLRNSRILIYKFKNFSKMISKFFYTCSIACKSLFNSCFPFRIVSKNSIKLIFTFFRRFSIS